MSQLKEHLCGQGQLSAGIVFDDYNTGSSIPKWRILAIVIGQQYHAVIPSRIKARYRIPSIYGVSSFIESEPSIIIDYVCIYIDIE